MTFDDVYEEWTKRKYPTVSESNVKGYTAAYKTCSSLYHKVFKDLKLVDLQTVIDTCGKNYPTLRKIKVLFNQLYDFAIKNDICNKDYSTFVDVVQYKDRNPNKYDRNKFEKEEIERIWEQKDDKYYQIILMLLYNGVRISEFLDLKKENVHPIFNCQCTACRNAQKERTLSSNSLLKNVLYISLIFVLHTCCIRFAIQQI